MMSVNFELAVPQLVTPRHLLATNVSALAVAIYGDGFYGETYLFRARSISSPLWHFLSPTRYDSLFLLQCFYDLLSMPINRANITAEKLVILCSSEQLTNGDMRALVSAFPEQQFYFVLPIQDIRSTAHYGIALAHFQGCLNVKIGFYDENALNYLQALLQPNQDRLEFSRPTGTATQQDLVQHFKLVGLLKKGMPLPCLTPFQLDETFFLLSLDYTKPQQTTKDSACNLL